MIFRPLSLLLCFAAPLLAQDAAKPAETPAVAAAPGWQWQVPSYATMGRIARLSEGARARLEAEFAGNSEVLQSLSLKEYNARFEKAFRAAVQEDEAKGLSSGGVPAEIFTARSLRTSRSSGSGSPWFSSGTTRAPRTDHKERLNKFSDAAKKKLSGFINDNLEHMRSLATAAERRAFFEAAFDKIEQEDAAAKTK